MPCSTLRLGAVALAFQSGTCTSPCHNPVLKLVPQTSVGLATMTQHIGEMHVNNVTVPAQTTHTKMNMTKYSIDFEKMNMRCDMVMEMEMPSTNKTIKMEVNQIMNWEAGYMTQYINGRCSTNKLPKFLPPASVMSFLMHRMMTMYSCDGRVGDLDTYVTGMDFPPKWLPIKMKEAVGMHISMGVDDDGLIKSETMKEHVKTAAFNTDVDMEMTFSKVSVGGPSAADLVPPASWSCASPSSEEDFNDEWSRVAVGRNRLIPQLIKAAAAQSSYAVVV